MRELFGAVATYFEFEASCEPDPVGIARGIAEFFMARFPPVVTARAMLGDRFRELRERIVEIWKSTNQANDGSLRLPQEYLLSIIHQ